jgi:ribonuclease E
MKEGTAALHVQVPVEVASFLLNEKRTDIAKLEARLKVTIVLIPNKHLETPNYTLERLRHDDPRLEEAKASYAMADGPAADSPYLKQKEEVTAKPRQEAVVKGITPSTPAPVAAPRPARGQAAESKPSFLSRLFSLFMGSPKTEDKPATRTGERTGGRQNRRGGNNGRGGDRSESRQGRDRGQDRNQDRDRSESDQNRQGRNKRGRGNGRGDKAEGQENRQEASQGQANQPATQAGQNGGQRGRRGAKPTDPSLAPDAEQNLTLAANTEAAGPVDGQPAGDTAEGEGNGRRRRRRRGSRGRGQGEESQQTSMDLAADESTAEPSSAESGASVDPIAVPAEAVPVAVAPAVPVAPVAAPEPIVVAEVTATPAPTPAPTPVPVAEPVDPAKLNQVLDAVGLQWVQTDPNKAPVEAIAEPPPKLGRKPKRSQQTAETEPMVMVETRSSEQPPAS